MTIDDTDCLMEFNNVADIVTGISGWKTATKSLKVWNYTTSITSIRNITDLVIRF
jgi:hypothetical protein